MESVPWSAFAEEAPDLASFGEARLAAAPSYLASVRGAELPRIDERFSGCAQCEVLRCTVTTLPS